jgi:hypothetical protein
MEYYLTKMICQVSPIHERVEVIQLVKASSPESAREEVKRAAIEEKGEDIVIFEIRVQETLIGK